MPRLHRACLPPLPSLPHYLPLPSPHLSSPPQGSFPAGLVEVKFKFQRVWWGCKTVTSLLHFNQCVDRIQWTPIFTKINKKHNWKLLPMITLTCTYLLVSVWVPHRNCGIHGHIRHRITSYPVNKDLRIKLYVRVDNSCGEASEREGREVFHFSKWVCFQTNF